MPKADKSSGRTLEPGFVVEIWTENHDREHDGNGFVGEVQAVDKHGGRVTLVDWFVGSFSSWDVFVPWREIKETWIATPEHHVGQFLDRIVYRTRHQEAAAEAGERLDARSRSRSPPDADCR